MDIDANLKRLGLELPTAVAPAFKYEAVVVDGLTAWVSGQIPRTGDKVMMTGKVGAEVTIEMAQAAARACILQGLSQIKLALGGWQRIRRVVKVTGFVASAPGFTQQPQVIDAASGLLLELMGDAGKHARSAVGVAELPRGVPVEIEMVIALNA